MAKYIIYKPQGKLVRIDAYLEDRMEGEYITAAPILKPEYATYKKIALQIPAELKPESYTGTYGNPWLAFFPPEGYRFVDGDDPTVRYATYTANGKTYAYRDCLPYREDSANPAPGRMVRVRLEIANAY